MGSGLARAVDATARAGKRYAVEVGKPYEDLNLVVVRASEAELAAHEALLETLREQGECVWDRLGDTSQAAK